MNPSRNDQSRGRPTTPHEPQVAPRGLGQRLEVGLGDRVANDLRSRLGRQAKGRELSHELPAHRMLPSW